jgi:hypothetical protein
MKSGSLNLLETSGPVKACNRVALSLPYRALLDVVEITSTMHRFAPLLYSIYRLLHVSAVVCNQGAFGSV